MEWRIFAAATICMVRVICFVDFDGIDAPFNVVKVCHECLPLRDELKLERFDRFVEFGLRFVSEFLLVTNHGNHFTVVDTQVVEHFRTEANNALNRQAIKEALVAARSRLPALRPASA